MCSEVSVRSRGQRGRLRPARRPQTGSDGAGQRPGGLAKGRPGRLEPGSGAPSNQQWAPARPAAHPSAGTQAHQQGSRMPGDGLGGQTSLWSGHGAEVPGPALSGPHQTAKHKAPLRRADNQPFGPRAAGRRSLHLFLPSSCE